MQKLVMSIVVLSCLLMGGCFPLTQLYYKTDGLNGVAIGDSKAKVLATFPPNTRPMFGQLSAPGMQIRAAQRSRDGKLLEVGEVLLTDGVTPGVHPYWFLFENSQLVQWGRPEDWKSAAARYDINFNPSPGVSR